MQVSLPDDIDVQQRARDAGFATVDDYVHDLIKRDVCEIEPSGRLQDLDQASNEAWIRDFRAFIESIPSHNPNFDDSRESIYPVR